MNKRLTLLAAACLLSGNALAGDFTGFYVGAHFGQGSGDSDNTVTLGGQWTTESQALRDEFAGKFSRNLEPDGNVLGMQFGYDHQFEGGFVLGGEFDFSKLDVNDRHITGPQPTVAFPSLTYDFTNRIETDQSASLRLKLGYAHGAHLFYATGGVGQVEVDATAGVVSNGNYRKRGQFHDRLDTTVWGVGYEYMFAETWSVRVDYLSTDADDFTYNTVYQAGSAFVTPAYTETVRQDLDYDAFRVGVNYRF